MSVLSVGSEALLVYPEGDCDTVTIVEFVGDPMVLGSHVVIRGANGMHALVLPEDLGIGVDDEIEVVF